MQLHLANFHQWFAEKEVIPWGNVVAVLSKEMNLSDEIVQKLYEYMKPTALLKPTTYQTQSKTMAFYCKEYNGIHSFMHGCVVCVINTVVCVCVCVCLILRLFEYVHMHRHSRSTTGGSHTLVLTCKYATPTSHIRNSVFRLTKRR